MKSRKKRAVPTQFHTVKRIDNSRLVRHVEPVRLRSCYRTAGVGAMVAVFFMMYIYQHFHCIDLSFQLEDLKAKETQFTAFNSELRLEIERLRDPRRIDVIARRQLGLTQPLPTQVQEYDAPNASEVAAAQYASHDSEQ
jgi:cell division protein FtsL